jgi:hypothetical protein
VATKPKIRKLKDPAPTGIEDIDGLASLSVCRIGDYIRAVSAYVCCSSQLLLSPKKAAQIRLSNALATALEYDLKRKLPKNIGPRRGEEGFRGAAQR